MLMNSNINVNMRIFTLKDSDSKCTAVKSNGTQYVSIKYTMCGKFCCSGEIYVLMRCVGRHIELL